MNTALDSFLEKWRARWPEWQIAETFVPASQRELAVAWFALLQEFEDAMNVQGETLPADAKLAWWGEELRDWSRQRSRHPLGRVLEPHAAPWFALGEVLPVLQQLRATPASGASAFATVAPLAQAIASIEKSLFGVEAAEADLIASHWLALRLFGAGDIAAPKDGDEAAWSRQLLQKWPQNTAAGVPRKIHSALLRERLRRLRPGTQGIAPASLPRVLWLAWRAARN